MRANERRENHDAKHNGSSLDDFPEEGGYRGEVESAAIKRVLASQFERMTGSKRRRKGQLLLHNELSLVGATGKLSINPGVVRCDPIRARDVRNQVQHRPSTAERYRRQAL